MTAICSFPFTPGGQLPLVAGILLLGSVIGAILGRVTK